MAVRVLTTFVRSQVADGRAGGVSSACCPSVRPSRQDTRMDSQDASLHEFEESDGEGYAPEDVAYEDQDAHWRDAGMSAANWVSGEKRRTDGSKIVRTELEPRSYRFTSSCYGRGGAAWAWGGERRGRCWRHRFSGEVDRGG